MKLSVIIPVYNEEKTIRKVLADIFGLKLAFSFEVIVVDDASTDGTPSAVRSACVPVTYIRQVRNLGKGAAIRRGLAAATGEFILIQDADREYSPSDYPALMRPLLSGEAQVVYGSRELKQENKRSGPGFYLGGRLSSMAANLLYGSSITDLHTGYKVFSAALLRSLELSCRGFEFCPEVTAKVLRRGIRITEVPVSYAPRSRKEGKKITWKDGLHSFFLLFMFRFTSAGISGPRRVLYVSRFKGMGGGEKSLLVLLANLDRKQWQPYLVCFDNGLLAQKARQLGVEVGIIGFRGLFRDLKALVKLVWFIRTRRIDLVHVNSFDIRAGVAARLAGVPLIGHLRVIFPMTWVDRLFVRMARQTIAVSDAVIRNFAWGSAGAQRSFTVVPNAVDVSGTRAPVDLKRDYGLPPHLKVVGCVGRMDRLKGFEYFIDACSRVRERMPETCFFIVGDANNREERAYREQLKKKARGAGFGDRFVFAGFREDILEVIASFDVCVAPSLPVPLRGGRVNEGFGRTAIEAMAMGVPMVASRAGGFTEIIDDGVSGILVPPGDPEAIASAVTMLLTDIEKARAIAAEGRRKFERLFTVDRHLRAVQEIYARCLRKPLKGKNCAICGGTEFRMAQDSGGGYQVYECLSCRFSFVDPQPDTEALARNYSSAYYHPWLQTRAGERQKMWKERLSLLDSLRGSRGRLLDIGCAEGDFVRLAADEGWDAYGTEFSAFASLHANLSGVRVLRGQLAELKLPAKSFDAITAWHVVEHVPDPLALLKECRRLIRDDGYLVIALPNLDNHVFRLAYHIFRGRRMPLFDPAGRELHLFHFSPLTLRIALEKAGFRVERLRADKGIVEPGKRLVDAVADIVSATCGKLVNGAILAVARPEEPQER